MIDNMNYYAHLYYGMDGEYMLDYTQAHIKIVEGVYESQLRQKAKEIGIVNFATNSFYKQVKQPYNVIHIGENTITLKRMYGSETYTLLSHLLTTEGYTQERIAQITAAVHNISNNTSIKTNQNWVRFD
jgi:hypothetical protein